MNSKAVNALVEILELIRKDIDPEMPIQMVVVFLRLALKGEASMQDLMDAAGISQASISRNVSALSKTHRRGKPGHNLVIAFEDPMERRRKLVRLSTKGKKLADKVSDLVTNRCELVVKQ